MFTLPIDPRDATPIYAQLERGLRAAIASGRLKPGDQLPTVRQLAVDLRVNANTVARVYTELERTGVLETRRGVGSFVRATAEEARPPKEHERRLRALATRMLADAAAAGFTPQEIIAELDAQAREGPRAGDRLGRQLREEAVAVSMMRVGHNSQYSRTSRKD